MVLQVPNAVALNQEAMDHGALLDFRVRWTVREKYRVAANLWANGGMRWEDAMVIAEQAFSR